MKQETQLSIAFGIVGVFAILVCYFMISSSSTSVSKYDKINYELLKQYEQYYNKAEILINADPDTLDYYLEVFDKYQHCKQVIDSLYNIQ